MCLCRIRQAYLWLVFFVFLVHEWIVLADNHIGFRFYGLAAINALVLSKIMLIAEGLRFGERFDNKPLIVPIAYKFLRNRGRCCRARSSPTP
jgi:hypothetical protein